MPNVKSFLVFLRVFCIRRLCVLGVGIIFVFTLFSAKGMQRYFWDVSPTKIKGTLLQVAVITFM